MRPVSARYLASLGLARYTVAVDWSLDGQTWQPCTYVGGDVTADATSQVRWSISSMQLAGVDVGPKALSPFGTLLRVFSGMVLDVDDVEWVPLGVYRAKTVDRTGATVQGDRVLSVSGQSRESVVIGDRFTTPRTFRSQDGVYLAEQLLRESVPGASWLSRVDPDESPQTPKLIGERDRWALIDGDRDAKSIARSLGARVFTDGAGAFIMAPTPTLLDPVVWTIDSGDDGVLIEPAESLSDEDVYNMVVASGSTEDTDEAGKPIPPVGPAIIADTDPTSPTRVDGPFGRKPRFYSSPLLRTLGQCGLAAQSLLAQNLGLRHTVTVTSAPNFALEVDDVINVRMPSGDLEAHVVETITYPLGGGSMQIGTRATSSRFAGQPQAAPEATGDIDDGTGIDDE